MPRPRALSPAGAAPAAAAAADRRGRAPTPPPSGEPRRNLSAPASPRPASGDRRKLQHPPPLAKGGRKGPTESVRATSNKLTINLKDARHAADIVREVAVGQLGWKETVTMAEDCTANLFWYERAITVAEVKLLNECQRVNMIPGMHDMARKSSLARALNRMRKLYPADFAFFPPSWHLPAQLDEFKKHCAFRQHCGSSAGTFIVKPSGGCQGTGIYLTASPEALSSTISNAVVQEYIEAPLLLEGRKFDFRLYVLVTSIHPLVAYLYREGMARFIA
jgi:hypothetical protein